MLKRKLMQEEQHKRIHVLAKKKLDRKSQN